MLCQPRIDRGEYVGHRSPQLDSADDGLYNVRVGIVVPKTSLFTDQRREKRPSSGLLGKLAHHAQVHVRLVAALIGRCAGGRCRGPCAPGAPRIGLGRCYPASDGSPGQE